MVSGGKKARGKHRLDKFYHLAKEQGYRSRAAFKLIQLNKKHGFLNDARAVLDLCAAPGGWLQVCAKHMPLSARIIGVDLDAIKPIRGVKTFVDDITTQKCRDRLRKESEGSLFDVVLHDGAPNVGGAFATEQYTQSALVLDSLTLACEFLRPEGTFVTKVFRSRDYTALLYAFKQLFKRVDATKPQASRNTSAEIFVVCMGFKAPAKIDPRLLDHRVLFQDVQEQPKVMGPDALLKSVHKKQRHRTGYDENVSMMHNAVSSVAFVMAKDPVPMLAQYTCIKIQGPESKELLTKDDEEQDQFALEPAEMAEIIRGSPATTEEVLDLSKDLQVLGRSEFKTLLKWRLKVRKAIDDKAKAAKKAAAEEEGESDDEAAGDDDASEELSPEEKLLKEMEELRAKIDHGRKKDRKKRRVLKKKAKIRLAAMAQTAGIGEEPEGPEDERLFTLKTLKSRSALADARERSVLDADDLETLLDAPDSDEEMVSSEGAGSGSDSEDDLRRYEAMVDEYLDNAYKGFLERRSAKVAQKVERVKRKRLADAEEEKMDRAELEGLPSNRGMSDSEDEEVGGGLIVDLDDEQAGTRKSGGHIAQQWFAQDAFQDDDLLDDDDDVAGRTVSKKRKTAASDSASDADVSDAADDYDEDEDDLADGYDQTVSDDEDGAPAARQASRRKGGAGGGGHIPGHVDSDDEEADAIRGMKDTKQLKQVAAQRRAAEKAVMEVVPQTVHSDGSDSTDTEDEFEAMDDNAKAEIRAMARKWMKSRKNQLSILDAAYNRYTFNDEGLPRWFQEDEQRHMRPMTPATREELEAERELMRAIDARPMKKVAEAKARKRQKLLQKVAQARQKAEAIVDNEDMSVRSKAKEIEKLYAKAKRSKGKRGSDKDKKLSRSAKEAKSRKGPPLDRRMIADKMKGKARAMNTGKGKGRKKR